MYASCFIGLYDCRFMVVDLKWEYKLLVSILGKEQVIMSDKMIECQDVIYSYTNEEDGQSKFAINGVNLQISKGEFLVILGHNGSGKSTLAKHMNALLLPSGGKVYVDGIDTSDLNNTWDVRSRAGMVFQNPDNQLVATIVEEDVAFGPENLGVEPLDIRNRVDDSLKAVGMFEYRKHAPHLLSGGQKQRVAIAGILAMRPKCIVLDEPTAMLDPSGRKEVVRTIKDLNKSKGITIVLITHYMEEAVEADRIVVMDQGKVMMEGSPKEVFSNVSMMKKIGLDVPQVTELAYELNKSGLNLPMDILTIDEMVNALCMMK
jgi:energy-coupling factor transport system ATP-binding protein